jgi:hypothetical protein
MVCINININMKYSVIHSVILYTISDNIVPVFQCLFLISSFPWISTATNSQLVPQKWLTATSELYSRIQFLGIIIIINQKITLQSYNTCVIINNIMIN